MSQVSICGAKEYETSDPRTLPTEAVVLGPRHNPIAHRDFAVGMIEAIEATGLEILEQTHVVDGIRNMDQGGNYGAVTVPGANIFSLFKIRHPTVTIPGGDLMIGARNSVAQALAAQACIGVSFPVCTNLSLFGHDLLFKRKNTTFAVMAEIMRETVAERVYPMLETVQGQIERLQSFKLTRVQREATVYRMVAKKALPAKMLAPMDAIFQSSTDFPEVGENFDNALGVMHAATRCIQTEKTRRQAELSQSISRFFAFGTDTATA